MLLKVTGSSGAGKSTVARAAAAGLPSSVVVHDFDEVGVPERPTTCWRHEHNEWWVRRALAYEREGRHLLLTGQSPIGEVIATPSATELSGVAVCLVDVSDDQRVERLRLRHGEGVDSALEQAYVRWAEWHRRHAEDPQHAPGVIAGGDCRDMAWGRWSGWAKGDPRWCVEVIDTTDVSIAAAAEALRDWVERQLDAWSAGAIPLARGSFG